MQIQSSEQPSNNGNIGVQATEADIQQVFTFSQFINTVRYIRSEDDFKYLRSMQYLLEQQTEQSKSSSQKIEDLLRELTPYQFRQLVVQFFYLLYSCSYKRIVPIPEDNQKFLCFCTETNTIVLCVSQFITFQTSEVKDFQSKVPYFTYYKNFGNAIHPFWKVIQKKHPVKRQALTADYFLKKLNQTNQLDFSSEKQAFNTFQRAQFFIQTSILLRIRNSALVCIVRKQKQLVQHFQKHTTIQKQLSEDYNDRRKRKNNIEKVLQTQKNIQKNIEEFFVTLNRNPKYYKVQDRKKKQAFNSLSSGFHGGSVGSSQGMNKLLIGLKVYELMDMRPPFPGHEGYKQIDEDYYNLYEIEYCSSKNLIIVKMVTDLILDWATSDSILFKWNTLTFQTSNVGLQTIQKLDQTKKIKKFVVIRGTSYFNKKEPVIQKILTLIDITMATYKSIQLQMKSQTFFSKNLSKIDQSYAKINHYLKNIHKSCVRSYSMLKELEK